MQKRNVDPLQHLPPSLLLWLSQSTATVKGLETLQGRGEHPRLRRRWHQSTSVSRLPGTRPKHDWRVEIACRAGTHMPDPLTRTSGGFHLFTWGQSGGKTSQNSPCSPWDSERLSQRPLWGAKPTTVPIRQNSRATWLPSIIGGASFILADVQVPLFPTTLLQCRGLKRSRSDLLNYRLRLTEKTKHASLAFT